MDLQELSRERFGLVDLPVELRDQPANHGRVGVDVWELLDLAREILLIDRDHVVNEKIFFSLCELASGLS